MGPCGDRGCDFRPNKIVDVDRRTAFESQNIVKSIAEAICHGGGNLSNDLGPIHIIRPIHD